MNLGGLIISTLKPLNIPVSLLKYSGTASNYVIFLEYLQQGEGFSEDDEEVTGHYIQVNLMTTDDNTILVQTIKDLLKTTDMKRTGEYDFWDETILRYNHTFRFLLLEAL